MYSLQLHKYILLHEILRGCVLGKECWRGEGVRGGRDGGSERGEGWRE